MARDIPDTLAGLVTNHNRIVLLLTLLLTAGVVGGITQLEMQGSNRIDSDSVGHTEVAKKHDYMNEHYGAEDSDVANATRASVYIRNEDGNALSKQSLLESLRFQRTVRDNESVAAALVDEGGVLGVTNVVARQLAGDQAADLDAQIRALEGASEADVRTVVSRSLTEDSPLLVLLPNSYEPGSTSAESRRIVFTFESVESQNGFPTPPPDAQRALYKEAQVREDADYFTLGQFAAESYGNQQMQDTIELILPAALLFILAVLGFAYRDIADVIVGFVGVIVSVLWMFGILGWLGVPAGMTVIIGPVLITGLSIDYGLHVFMRHREQRGPDDGIRLPMGRALSSVGVAFALVTITTAVGFLANLTSPFGLIRDLGVGITLGVVSAFVVFTTLVPALKVSVDGLLERYGIDRHKTALGKGRYLRPILSAGVGAARRAAPLVIVVAILAGASGAATWTVIDRQAYQTSTDVAEWKTDLPGPLAWEAVEDPYYQNGEYVQEKYQSTNRDQRLTAILVEGDVTDPEALSRLEAGIEDAQGRDAVFTRDGQARITSPLSVMQAVAAEDDDFARTFEAADTDGDGVPDQNFEGVYDALYEAAPDQASQVIERRDGEYPSMRLLVPVEQGLEVDVRAEAMHGIADTVEGDSSLSATAVGQATFENAELGQIADGIFRTMLIALGVIGIVLAITYRISSGSATLGALTVVPISLVVGLVLGGMHLTGTPVTFVTALLMSLVIGLGVDYNIHISDRFAQELDLGKDPVSALRAAVTGTGGALLGSSLTSGGAFATLLLHVSPQLRGFGMLVVLSLSLAFVVSVFVFPSMLLVWARWMGVGSTREQQGVAAGAVND